MPLCPAPSGGYDYPRFPRQTGNQPPVQAADPRSRQQPAAHSYGQEDITAVAYATTAVPTVYDDASYAHDPDAAGDGIYYYDDHGHYYEEELSQQYPPSQQYQPPPPQQYQPPPSSQYQPPPQQQYQPPPSLQLQPPPPQQYQPLPPPPQPRQHSPSHVPPYASAPPPGASTSPPSSSIGTFSVQRRVGFECW